MVEINDTHPTGDTATIVVCAPLSQLRATVEEKRKEGWEPLGASVGTGAKVTIEGHEIPEMAQTMIRRKPAVSSDAQSHGQVS